MFLEIAKVQEFCRGITYLSFSFIQPHTTINSTNFKSFLAKIVFHYIQNLSPLREDQNLIGNV